VLCVQCECMAVACSQSQSVNEANRQQLVSDIVDSQLRDDSAIQHVTNHALAKSNTSAHRQFTSWLLSCFIHTRPVFRSLPEPTR